MKLDLRKTRAATVVDDGDGDFLVYDDQKSSFLSNLEINPISVISFVLKLAVCGVGVVALQYVEKQNLDKLNGQKSIVQGELNGLVKSKSKKKKKWKVSSIWQKNRKSFIIN